MDLLRHPRDVHRGAPKASIRLAIAGIFAVATILALEFPLSALELNAGKYGATFYWWYDHLPATTLYAPTIKWDARDQNWWTTVVKQARDAGLGWLAPGCWGEASTADPVTLGPLLTAIDAAAPALKLALFDDTTSEVLRKNLARGHGWNTATRFDLTDVNGAGEGGFKYFYDQQWKRFFQAVPPRYRLTIDGRPVVFMWHGGYEAYSHQNFFHQLLAALRQAVIRDFGVNPFVIVEESWLQLDPATEADAVYDWFQPHKTFATLTTWNGVSVGHTVPGYDCSKCNPPGPIVTRQSGALYQAGLQAIAPGSDLVLIEGFNNVDENAHLVETPTWGRLYLSITKWFSSNVP